MAARNRSSLISKLHKVLKLHFKPVLPNGDRPLLEHMLFACCLENAPFHRAEKTFQNLATSFFDWNEVRVSTVKELAEAMRDLPDPAAAASNLKRVLQTVFESTYSFDLEMIKKQNIGAGIKRLHKLEGATPFIVAYATQHGLGGHYIPLDRGALDVLYIVGIGTESERASGSVAGLERAIPKNKGIAFGSLLHQLAADYIASPFSTNVKNLLLAINPDAKHRFPKRGQKKEEPAAPLDAHKAVRVSGAAPDAKPMGAKPGDKAAAQKAAAQSAKKHLAAGKHSSARPGGKQRKSAHAALAPAGRSAPRKSAGRQLSKRKPR